MAGQVDFDGDGFISLFEAHIYSLKTAVSTDLPRSTSEMYLEKWEPWYLRWIFFIEPEENIYSIVAQEVAAKNGLVENGKILIEELLAERSRLQEEDDKYERESKKLRAEEEGIRKRIQNDIEDFFPEAMHPHTLNYLNFLINDLERAQDFILAHKQYHQLKELQDRQEDLQDKSLQIKRHYTQLDKILRLQKLARLQYFFNVFASDKEKNEYQQLVECEQLPL